jgi:hypothetical protein
MGTWSLPRTTAEFEKLFTAIQSPFAASTAEDRLYHLLGDDDLFDNIAKAKKVDQTADVRSLVVNRIWQIYLTGHAPTSITSEPLTDAIMATISRPVDAEDVFHHIKAIKDTDAAKQKVMWACDAKPEDVDKFTASRELNGMDYIVTDSDDRVFRVEAISEVVCEIDPDNVDLYGIERQIKLQF